MKTLPWYMMSLEDLQTTIEDLAKSSWDRTDFVRRLRGELGYGGRVDIISRRHSPLVTPAAMSMVFGLGDLHFFSGELCRIEIDTPYGELICS